jgi:hypothetical protein
VREFALNILGQIAHSGDPRQRGVGRIALAEDVTVDVCEALTASGHLICVGITELHATYAIAAPGLLAVGVTIH